MYQNKKSKGIRRCFFIKKKIFLNVMCVKESPCLEDYLFVTYLRSLAFYDQSTTLISYK